MDQAVKKCGFNVGNIVTVINENDVMHGLQGEVVRNYFDDEISFELMVIVKFHINIVGKRNDLRQVGDYYEGIRSQRGPMTFTYQDRTPNISSIRLDSGYTEDSKRKIGVS